MHDMENMRSAAGLTSSLVSYFINDGLNAHQELSACMESIAEKVNCPVYEQSFYLILCTCRSFVAA